MSKYQDKLDKNSIKWLKTYGYCLNYDNERFIKLRCILKERFKFEYYMWVDLDIKKEAEKLVPVGERYWLRKFESMKRKLVKEKYGIIKEKS